MNQLTAVALVLWMSPGVALAADTLVTSKKAGAFEAGEAKSWTTSADTVVFELQDSADGAKIAQTLKERLAQATITLNGKKLSIKGIPPAALLDQLSTLSLTSNDADPLAALAGLGASTGPSETPEGGGSIRASKPTPMAALTPEVGTLFEADVVEVVRGTFPVVSVKVRLKKLAKNVTFKNKLRYGNMVEAVVKLGNIRERQTQQTLGAYYLKKGDRVSVRLLERDEGGYATDWLERL